MKSIQIDEFETLQGQLDSFYLELNTLTKKNPNDSLNRFKLGLINSVLKRCNSFLGPARLPFAGFEVFDEQALPSTSDALVIVSQYLNSFEVLRVENIEMKYGKWYWIEEDGDEHSRMTAAPKRLAK